MLDPAMSTEKNSLETYLVTTFSKIEDQNGVKLDITPALPLLVAILTGTATELANKKYDFIGEAACQFAIRCILAKNYPDLDDRILNALCKKFRALQQVNKLVLKEIQLKQHVDSKVLSPQIVQTISGVLYSHFGTPAVKKFIDNAVSSIASIELGEANAKLKTNQQENPLQQFNSLVNTSGGKIEAQALETPDKQWQVKVVAQLKSTSLVFSHARIGGSKRKAKSAAYQDILTYLENYPNVYEQLQVANIESKEIHPLPISESDYVISTASTPTSAQNITTADLNGNTQDSNNIHLSFTNDEDAIRQLSRLLLGGDTDMDSNDEINESPTKKRMRDDQRQHQTGMEGIFSSYIGTESVDVKSEPVIIKTEYDLDAAREQLLASISQNESSAPVQTTQAPTQPFVPILDPMQAAPVSQPSTTSASVTATEDILMEEEPYNPFVSAPSTIEVNPKIILYFKQVFRNNRNTMLQAINMPGQCKSIFLSLVLQNSDRVAVDLKSNQVGPPHGPVFNAELVLKSKEYGNMIIKTDTVARRKKDAEYHAFHKLVCLLK